MRLVMYPAGRHDTGLRQIGEAIERSGVHLEFVPQPAPLETCWYTIGLTDHRHPELILFGLPPTISRPVLHTLAREVIQDRRKCVAGQYADDVLEEHPGEVGRYGDPGCRARPWQGDLLPG